MDEADRLCVTSTTQAEDAGTNKVAYKALTEPELAALRVSQANIAFTQATFTALATRKVLAGPIALARYKSDEANSSPNRIYAVRDLVMYGFTEELLNAKAWKENEAQYCMFLASQYKYPLSLTQENELKADYIKTDGTAKQYKAVQSDTTFVLATKYTREQALGAYSLLKYVTAAYQVWNDSEEKPTDIFDVRTFTKFQIDLDSVLKRISFGKLGWNRILNNAWDYSNNKDKLATGVSISAYGATE